MEKDVLMLGNKKGNNADLFLLDKIHALETQLVEIKKELTKNPPEDAKIEKVALRLATKIASAEKGADGKTPTEDELLALIRPLIPQVIDGHTPTNTELLDLIKPLIPKIKDGNTPSDEHLLSLIQPLIPILQNGKDADEQKIITQVTAKIETDLPKLGEPIRDSLELLRDDNRLDVSAVKGIEEKFKKLREEVGKPKMGMRKIPIVKRVSLTSQVNGITKSFTLPKDTVAVLGLFGTQFPITFDDSDWTLSGTTLTLASSVGVPQSGQTLVALLEVLFY